MHNNTHHDALMCHIYDAACRINILISRVSVANGIELEANAEKTGLAQKPHLLMKRWRSADAFLKCAAWQKVELERSNWIEWVSCFVHAVTSLLHCMCMQVLKSFYHFLMTPQYCRQFFGSRSNHKCSRGTCKCGCCAISLFAKREATG